MKHHVIQPPLPNHRLLRQVWPPHNSIFCLLAFGKQKFLIWDQGHVQLCSARHQDPWTPSNKTDSNVDCAFVKIDNFFHWFLIVKCQLNRLNDWLAAVTVLTGHGLQFWTGWRRRLGETDLSPLSRTPKLSRTKWEKSWTLSSSGEIWKHDSDGTISWLQPFFHSVCVSKGTHKMGMNYVSSVSRNKYNYVGLNPAALIN